MLRVSGIEKRFGARTVLASVSLDVAAGDYVAIVGESGVGKSTFLNVVRNGGIYEIPHVPFSYYPMNLELLYLIPLYFGNDIFPKYIHFAFALFSAGLIFSYLHRRLGRATDALLGVVLFLSLPVVIKLSITVYVDLGLVFFSTAALLQLLRWSETGSRPRHLVLSGIFAGLCLGTKPNGMLTVFLLSLAVPVLFQRAAAGQGGDRPQDPSRQGKGSRRALQSLAWTASFVAVARWFIPL